MTIIDTLDALEALYGTPAEAARIKVTRRLTPAYRDWIESARFCILTTVGPEGTDASPRGDDGPVVRVQDPGTLLLPDWRGNDRIDSLRNIVADGRASLLFMVAGANTILRVNGRAAITTDARLKASFARGKSEPRCVVNFAIAETYFQCARALMRADLWNGRDDSAGLPSPGEMLRQASDSTFDGDKYDAQWPGRAAQTLW